MHACVQTITIPNPSLFDTKSHITGFSETVRERSDREKMSSAREKLASCSQTTSGFISNNMDLSPFSSGSSSSSTSSLPWSFASSSMAQLGGRTLDRHNPIIADSRRFTPVSSPLHPSAEVVKKGSKNKDKNVFSSAASPSVYFRSPLKPNENDQTPPPESSRYLLDDSICVDGFPDNEEEISPVKEIPVNDFKEDKVMINASRYSASSFLEKKKSDLGDDERIKEKVVVERDEVDKSDWKEDISVQISGKRSPSLASEMKPTSDRVVVFRASLHCRGCAGKVKKHLSKLEGVTSFNIDFAAKKVTVTGDVTPVGVLASISKVKRAQFWPEAKKES